MEKLLGPDSQRYFPIKGLGHISAISLKETQTHVRKIRGQDILVFTKASLIELLRKLRQHRIKGQALAWINN